MCRVGDAFHKKSQILKPKKKLVLFYHSWVFDVFTAPYNLKGSLNIQDFALIQAVLLEFCCDMSSPNEDRLGEQVMMVFSFSKNSNWVRKINLPVLFKGLHTAL